MRIKSLSMVILCAIILVFNNPFKSVPTANDFSRLQNKAVQLRIIESKTTLKRGESGIIKIQGTPGIRYILKTSYKKGGKLIPVSQWRVTDRNGYAAFNWFVEEDTTPGTHAVTISGDGQVLNINHVVTQ